MKKDQAYTFAIARPLTPASRRSIEVQIAEEAKATTEPVAFAWNRDDDGQLNVDVGPVKLDIVFYDDVVEVYADAPLLARVMISKEQEATLVGLVERVLTRAGLLDEKGRGRAGGAARA